MSVYRFQSYACSQAKELASIALKAFLFVPNSGWGLGALLIQYAREGVKKDGDPTLAVLCLHEDTPVGIAIIYFDLSNQIQIYIKPEHRRKGLALQCGQALLSKLSKPILRGLTAGVGGIGSPQMWHKLLAPYLKLSPTVLDRVPEDGYADDDLRFVRGVKRFESLLPGQVRQNQQIVEDEAQAMGLTLLTAKTRLTLNAFLRTVTYSPNYKYVGYDRVGNCYVRFIACWARLSHKHPWMKQGDPYLQFSKSKNKKKLVLWQDAEFFYWEHMRGVIDVKYKDSIGLYARILARSRVKARPSASSNTIFDCGAELLVNPVNTQGVMGAGLAKQFKINFPKSFKSYRKTCLARKLEPGGVHQTLEDGQAIAHLATKAAWSQPSKMSYITKGLTALGQIIQANHFQSVAIPALGCGLGGLSWPLVREEILQAAKTKWPQTTTFVFPPGLNKPPIIVNQPTV